MLRRWTASTRSGDGGDEPGGNRRASRGRAAAPTVLGGVRGEPLEREPVLVAPTSDDVDRLERELCAGAGRRSSAEP